MLSARKNPIEDSADMPNYLLIAKGKYNSNAPGNTKPFRPSKKCFPVMKYGVSADTPPEFQTTHSKVSVLMEKCVLFKDPAANQDSSKKILTKELIREWPVKNLQTFDIDQDSVPHKFETKPMKAKELYNCVNHESKVVQRPDLITGEETLYTTKFYETLKNSKGFQRKIGYFGQFAKRHKTTNEELRMKRSDSQGHSRYVGKPIMITSLNSKNKMNAYLSEGLSKLAQNGQDRSCSPKSRQTIESLSQRAHTQQDEPHQNYHQRENYRIRTEPADRSPSPSPVPSNYNSICIRKRSVNDNINEVRHIDLDALKRIPDALIKTKRSGSLQPMRTQIFPTNLGYAPEERLTTSINDKSANVVKQAILRYKTKEITQVISLNREQELKEDPESYIRHSIEGENRRNSNIEVSVLERSRKHVKINDGQQPRYISAPQKKSVRQDYCINDNIKKFEKHIDGLRKTSANFGHQRWFYDKNWKLERLNTFEDSPSK